MIRWVVLAATLFAAATALAVEAPEKAKCVVCALQGEEKVEDVAASRDYLGRTYYFCSSKCAAAFDEDPEAYAPPVLPRSAPRFRLSGAGGDTLSLETFRGKLLLVDFWATWCKPCAKVMPEIDALYREHRDDGLEVVGISIDEGDDRAEKVEKFLRKRKVGYSIVLDDASAPAWAAFKVKVLPSLYLIDADGRVVAQWVGKSDIADVRREVERRIAEVRTQ